MVLVEKQYCIYICVYYIRSGPYKRYFKWLTPTLVLSLVPRSMAIGRKSVGNEVFGQ